MCVRALTTFAIALLSAGCRAPARFEFAEPHMGTEFRVVLYAADAGAARRAADAAFARIAALDDALSDWDDGSELSRLSRASWGGAPSEPVAVSADLHRVLERAVEIAARTGGAFDPTIGPYVRLWRRSRRQGELPTRARLEEAGASVGYEKLELLDGGSVRLLAADMRLDLGGIAKGYALDEALEVLAALGVERALVDGGGDVACGAPPPGRAHWTIALEGARHGEYVGLADAAIATSGASAQFVEIGGLRYSHVVDARTGLGDTAGLQASVIARDAMTADAYASALCVGGVERVGELAARVRGAEAGILAALAEPRLAPPAADSGAVLLGNWAAWRVDPIEVPR